MTDETDHQEARMIAGIAKLERQQEELTFQLKRARASVEDWVRQRELDRLAEMGISELPAKVRVFTKWADGSECDLGVWWLKGIKTVYHKAYCYPSGNVREAYVQTVHIWRRALEDGSMGQRDPGWEAPTGVARMEPAGDAT